MINLHLTPELNISMPTISPQILQLALFCTLNHSSNVVPQHFRGFLWSQLPLSFLAPCHTSDFFCKATVSQFSHLGLIYHHHALLLALPSHLTSPLLIWCGCKCSQLYWHLASSGPSPPKSRPTFSCVSHLCLAGSEALFLLQVLFPLIITAALFQPTYLVCMSTFP